jgi:hypothetical protein
LRIPTDAVGNSGRNSMVHERDLTFPPCYAGGMAQFKKQTPLVDAKEAKRRHDAMDKAIYEFAGGLDELEGALGMYMLGRHVGWKVLYIIHSKQTIRKYEEILGIKVREEFDEVGPDARRSNGFRVVEAASNFWKTITSGQIPEKRHMDKAI